MYPSLDLHNTDINKSDAEKAKEKLQDDVSSQVLTLHTFYDVIEFYL